MSLLTAVATNPTTRQRIEEAVERLLLLLDRIDGDPDLEDGADAEPEETDQNGDEVDYGRCEDDALPAELFNVQFVPLIGGHGA